MDTAAVLPARSAGTAPRSSIFRDRRSSSPMIPKAGAFDTASLRSQSPLRPVRSTFSGAGRAGALAMSWICPSVTRMAPASRARGSSASASFSAVMANVPASSSASPRVTLRSSVFGSAATCASIRATASAVWPVRPDRVWLALWSMTMTTISLSGRLTSSRSAGSASATSSTSAASARSAQPVSPRQIASVRKAAASSAAAARIGQGTSGSKMMVSVTAPAFPEAPEHGPGRICSCRSAHA